MLSGTSELASLDDPARHPELRKRILGKPALHEFYRRAYLRLQEVIDRSTCDGQILEVGSGAGFIKQSIPEVTTSDVLDYPGLDLVMDGTSMPFQSNSLRTIFMLNVFHHVPDVAEMLSEIDRCLAPGGRVLIVDQHLGWISRTVLRHFHHEPYFPDAKEWKFDSSGPLQDANGALAWIVFQRDREEFRRRWPELSSMSYRPHSPLWYWLAGGLKSWSLLPPALFRAVDVMEASLLWVSPNFGSFVDIEIVKGPERDVR